MNLYFHTNTEMALYYIKDLLSDRCEHPMSEIYDYVMENCKGHAIMGESMRASVISSAVWRLAHTEGSGYSRLRRGIYQMGDPEKIMKEKPTPYEKAARIVVRAEREMVGNFYMTLDPGMDVEKSIQVQKAAREVLDKLAEIKSILTMYQFEFENQATDEPEMSAGMSLRL